ncbi:HNH endonuclease [Candidatus Soleaferrea massiliensis]|uniref:HNH endonuclease n=1 Tax=Candidatus Soleaferrea massiliensis TaxID=1470354 RepID=UPI00069334C5|nr:HNH endonuclease [Candidatus Soleaferrea massiliensis]
MDKRIYQMTKNIQREYYYDEVTVSTEQWIQVLKEPDVFTDKSLKAIMMLYEQPEHRGTCYEIGQKYNVSPRSINGIILHLAKRVCKYFDIQYFGVGDKFVYWIALMKKGRHVKTEQGEHFEWELRPELVTAIELLNRKADEEFNDDLISVVEIPGADSNFKGSREGKRVGYYTTKYERDPKNRKAAIQIHGAVCAVCGFDFEKVYGEIGRGFIEVHHLVPLSSTGAIVDINPYTDLVCLCSNCHRMIHRRRDNVLTIEELKTMIASRKI